MSTLMTPDEEWQRAQRIIREALAHPPNEWPSIAAEHSGNNARVRELAMDALNAHRASPVSAIAPDEQPAASVPSTIVDGDPSHPPSPRPPRPSPRATPASRRKNIDGTARSWGDFALLEEVGRGGFGVVYRAWDASLKRELALKIIDLSRWSDAREEMILREGQMLARIRHRHVVEIYGAQRIGREIGLAMEYVQGHSLSRLVSNHGPLPLREAVSTALSLCDALAAVHRGGLVHRDVKASNVMRETGGRIVLMDFGAGRDLFLEPRTRSEMVGTPIYMSPEVLRGSPASPNSDIYSLGVLLYHLLTGKYPESPATRSGQRPERDRRQSVATLPVTLPEALVDIIGRTIDSDPARRPATAISLKRELSQVLAKTPRHRGGRRPGQAPNPAPVTPDLAAQPPHSVRPNPVAPLQRGAVSVGAALALCAVLGLLTTLEFNAVLGRTGGFAEESPLVYLSMGARALIALVVYMSLAILAWISLAFVARIAAEWFPALRSRYQRVRAAVVSTLTRSRMDDGRTLAQAVCLCGTIALGVVLFGFQDLVTAFTSRIDQAPASVLALLSTDNRPMQIQYRLCLGLILLALLSGMFLLRQLPERDTRAPTLGVLALIALVLLCVAGPWRITFAAQFREAMFDGRPCFVIGEYKLELLLHCPSSPLPRNRVVERVHPALRVTSTQSFIFDAYSHSGTSPSH